MTEIQAVEEQYRNGAGILTHTDSQEEVERARAGLDGYSADPVKDDRPAYERTVYVPKAVSFNQLLELWAAHEGGRLLRVLHVPGKDDESCGEDDARRAWEWVSEVEGWNAIVHEVMKHLVLRNRTWEEWPREAPVKVQRVVVGVSILDAKGKPSGSELRTETWGFCDWPFISYEQAGAAWQPFYRNLRKRYRTEPFTISAQEAQFA